MAKNLINSTQEVESIESCVMNMEIFTHRDENPLFNMRPLLNSYKFIKSLDSAPAELLEFYNQWYKDLFDKSTINDIYMKIEYLNLFFLLDDEEKDDDDDYDVDDDIKIYVADMPLDIKLRTIGLLFNL